MIAKLEDDGAVLVDSLSMEEIRESAMFEIVEPNCGNDRSVWITDSGGCGDLMAAVLVVQAFFKAFNDARTFTLTWAETCSRPRIGEFGGGAVVVTRDKIDMWRAHDWVCDKIEKDGASLRAV